MQIPSVTSSKSAVEDPATIAANKPKKTMLGQEDFLKLLAVQFQSQDPMKPMEDTAFIAQMAQFTALDQSKSLLTQMTQMGASQDIVTANSYIGRKVTLDAGADQLVTGEVTGIEISEGSPRLIIGDQTYPLSAVLLVEPARPATTPETTTP
jgi:flagellar basal-body rod modification protein FlgD